MSDPLSYATTEFMQQKHIRDDMPARETTYHIIREFLEDCIDEGRGTSPAPTVECQFTYALNDLDKQFN